MTLRHILILFVNLILVSSYAQQEAVTSEGKKVILHDDGTWTYHPETGKTTSALKLEWPRASHQDKIIAHTGYAFVYNEEHEQAIWVAYELTAEETRKIIDRSDRFIPDPSVPTGTADDADYAGSGFDRGHLAPAADMGWSEQAMSESFYYSNMSPQAPSFNRGIWKKLEELVRMWAIESESLYIATGPVLRSGLPVIGPNRVSIPEYYYKVVLDYREPGIKGIGFLMPNQSSTASLQTFAVPIDRIEDVTGIDFFPAVPDEKEKMIEQEVCLPCWSWSGDRIHQEVELKLEAASVRCSAINQSGNRCKRMTQSSNGRCFQHGGK